MSSNIRRFVLVPGAFAAVLSVVVLCGSIAVSQQIAIKKGPAVGGPVGPGGPVTGGPAKPPSTSAVDLPIDNDRRKMIEAAVDYIKEEDWRVATETLQKLLMFPEDKMVEVDRKGPDGKFVTVPVSARKEADRLVGTLPAKGMEYYTAQYGGDAADMLKKAKENGRREDLALVMMYYFHTDAGAEATHLLASRLLDRGDYITASSCYERLLGREGADKLPANVLFEAAYAAHMVEIEKASSKEEDLWKQLATRTTTLKVGPDLKNVDDLKDLVGKLPRPNSESCMADSPMVGGSPSRTAQGKGGTAFMVPSWKTPLIQNEISSATKNWLNQANTQLHRRQPVIPAFQPITVTINDNGVAKPLSVYRTYGGVQATDMVTGKMVWSDPSAKWGMDNMLQNNQHVNAIQGWLNFYISQNQRPSIVYENSTIGTLSTDGSLVFAVNDLAVPPPPHFQNGMPNQQWGDKFLNEAVQCSTLQAFDQFGIGTIQFCQLSQVEKAGSIVI